MKTEKYTCVLLDIFHKIIVKKFNPIKIFTILSKIYLSIFFVSVSFVEILINMVKIIYGSKQRTFKFFRMSADILHT